MLKELVPSFESAQVLESELVPSLRNVVVVNNSNGRCGKGGFAAFSNFPDVLADGAGKGSLSEDGMTPDDVVNIQFTSGCVSGGSWVELLKVTVRVGPRVHPRQHA